jgi:putative redox protein
MAKHAQLKWTDGLQFVGRAGNAPAVVIDNPEGGSGPSPMDLVLMGVAGCTAMDVFSIMQKKRAVVNGFTINVRGKRDEKHPKRYTTIHIEYIIEGKGIKPAAMEQAISLSVTKYCSATASVNAGIEHSYRIIENDG